MMEEKDTSRPWRRQCTGRKGGELPNTALQTCPVPWKAPRVSLQGPVQVSSPAGWGAVQRDWAVLASPVLWARALHGWRPEHLGNQTLSWGEAESEEKPWQLGPGIP